MNDELRQLAERRAALIARAGIQRDALSYAAAPWRRPLAVADRGLSALRRLGQHPLLLASGAALMLMLGPRSVFKWAESGLLAWRVVKGVRKKLSEE